MRQIFEPLGTYRRSINELYYVIRKSDGTLDLFTSVRLWGLKGLIEIYPNAEHWRQIYGLPKSGKIDAPRAASDIIAACIEAGPYDLPSEMKPPTREERRTLNKAEWAVRPGAEDRNMVSNKIARYGRKQ